MVENHWHSLLAVTGRKCETLVSDMLHDHSEHLLIQQNPQQLAGKAMVPDSVKCCCQIDYMAPTFFLALKESSIFCVDKTTLFHG